MDSLNKRTVLILNKSWIPINTTSPKHAIVLLYVGKAKAMHVDSNEILPLEWNKWIALSTNNHDNKINATFGSIKIPNVILLETCNKIPKKSIKFTQKNLWERDNFTCQYTGRKVTRLTGNIDHIVPKCKGGKTSWENCVISHKDVNSAKKNQTPEQAGLSLIRKPVKPNTRPVSFCIKNTTNNPEWDLFLKF